MIVPFNILKLIDRPAAKSKRVFIKYTDNKLAIKPPLQTVSGLKPTTLHCHDLCTCPKLQQQQM